MVGSKGPVEAFDSAGEPNWRGSVRQRAERRADHVLPPSSAQECTTPPEGAGRAPSGILAAQEKPGGAYERMAREDLAARREDSQLAGVVAVDEDRSAEAELLGDSLSSASPTSAPSITPRALPWRHCSSVNTRNTRTSTL